MKKLLVLTFLMVSVMVFSLETKLTAEKVLVSSTGKEIKEEAATVTPGEVIEYVFFIKNSGNTSEYNLYPSIPIPEEMILVADQISPNRFEVSVDGENYVSYPVYDIEGKEVDPSAYKKVRWFIDEIKSGEEKIVKLRATLNE